jgi:hypothetical protein
MLGLALLVFLGGCGGGDPKQVYQVADVTKAQTISLHKKTGQGHIHSYTVVGTGRIEGEATLSLMLNGKPYRTEHLSGDVQFKWGGDWYSDAALIAYKPTSARSGSLKVEYTFLD